MLFLRKYFYLAVLIFSCNETLYAEQTFSLTKKSSIQLPSSVMSLAVHPLQEKLVAILDAKNTMTLLDTNANQVLWQTPQQSGGLPSGYTSYSSLKFSDSGQLLAVSQLLPIPFVMILDGSTGKKVRTIQINSMPSPIMRESVVGFSSDDRFIGMMSPDRLSEVSVIDLERGETVHRLPVSLRFPGGLSQILFSKDMKFVIGGFPGGFLIWDLNSHKIVKSLDATDYDYPSLPSTSVEISSDLRFMIVSQMHKQEVSGWPIVSNSIFDLESMKPLFAFETKGSTRAWFQPNQLSAIFYSADGQVRLQKLSDAASFSIVNMNPSNPRVAHYAYLANIESNPLRTLIYSGVTSKQLDIFTIQID